MSDVDCYFLIKVTHENSLTLTLQQQLRRPVGQPPPPAAQAYTAAAAAVQYLKPML